MALAATEDAIKDAGLNLKDIEKLNVGVIMGTTMGESGLLESLDLAWLKNWQEEKTLQRLIQSCPTLWHGVASGVGLSDRRTKSQLVLGRGDESANHLSVSAVIVGNSIVDDIQPEVVTSLINAAPQIAVVLHQHKRRVEHVDNVVLKSGVINNLSCPWSPARGIDRRNVGTAVAREIDGGIRQHRRQHRVNKLT